MSENAEKVQDSATAPVFNIEKLYTKDLSLEVPHAPQIFLEQGTPEIDMRVATQNAQIEEGYYSCDITVTVTAKVGEKVLFLAEVTQSGIFQIRHLPESDVGLLLGVACPNMLFPYAREAIANTVVRAGFPPVVLTPINFESMYNEPAANA